MATVLTHSGLHKSSATSSDGSGNNSTTTSLKDLDQKSTTIVTVSEDIPPLGVAKQEKRFWFQRSKRFDSSAIATQPSVYDDPAIAKQYQPRSDWENLHRFNPLARWTWKEEYTLIRKIDLRIMVFACIMFMALELDRANIQQANTDNFLQDLGLDTNDYNMGNTVFKLSFLCAELPSQLVSKWIGGYSFAASQFWLSGRSSFLTCRALLGLLQGGFIPDIILYLSYFYKHHELSLRLSFFWTAMSIADILAGFLAYGLLHMRGVEGAEGWRWLFLIEGLFTLLIGIAAFALMPPSPCQTANWIRGKKGWFTPREEEIIVNRVIREDPSKGQMHNRQPVTPKLLFKSLSDFDLWPLYFIGLLFQIPTNPPQQYLTLTLRRLGYGTFQSNLLAIPWNVLHIGSMLALAYSAEIFGELTFHSTIAQIWSIPFLAYLVIVDVTEANRWVIWGVITLLLSFPNPHPIQVGWNSRNSNTVRSRTVSAATYNMFVQASGIISSNVYQKGDAPNYRKGNKALLGLAVGNVGVYVLTKVYYVWRNKSRDRTWDAMSTADRVRYLETTTDEGNKRLDFRFAH
ncbi:hypothetical protein LTR17_013833 [Elasticomyces elasticus]|nr:hypothetical protein LTR17_013833 [Elasticomyces elasticus]